MSPILRKLTQAAPLSLGLAALLAIPSVHAQGTPGSGGGSGTGGGGGGGSGGGTTFPNLSLKGKKAPEPANLSEFVKDKDAAIRLGKALFWDMQAGSDGLTACATCHFSAGVDNRRKNQLNPGTIGGSTTFTAKGPNQTLGIEDFPFRRLADINSRTSTVLFDTKNISGSQGVTKQRFVRVKKNHAAEKGVPVADPTFQVGGVNVRQVTGRSSQSVINSVFNHRQFWDGRASSVFNGVSPFGVRDKNARIFVTNATGGLEATVVRIHNASLASQAVGPPLSAVEMSYEGRTWPDIGRKLLPMQPLALQHVRYDDSTLGALALPQRGLDTTYEAMVKAAFQPAFWSNEDAVVTFDAAGVGTVQSGKAKKEAFSQIEANFSLFWGLAIQLYEATLVSDQAPIDRFGNGELTALTPAQKRGFTIFITQRSPGAPACTSCHESPVVTDASVFVAGKEPIRLNKQGGAVDVGFHPTGVRPDGEDLGVGGKDPWGNPLDFVTSSQKKIDVGFPLLPVGPNIRGLNANRFKAPILRNVELTGPYMHNGGMATLMQVVDFYNRAGDFLSASRGLSGGGLQPMNLTAAEKSDLVEFLLCLTDPRVRDQSAPFDHPQLFVPVGAVGDGSYVVATKDDDVGEAKTLVARDELKEIPAVGRYGGVPVDTFLNLNPHQR